MRRGVVIALALATLASVPALAATGSAFDARVQRLVGMPTPVGPVLVGSDRVVWEITLDAPAVVSIEARAPEHSPFYLTTSCNGGLVALPSAHQGLVCSRPGVWTVEVDPAGGVAVDILARFRGRVVDPVSGAPATFGFREVSAGGGCVVPGVCLP